jgi:protein-tyrosine phosphatase
MYDVEITSAVSNARTITRCLHANQRVLVTCRMGLNRSALVAGLAMWRAFDMTAAEVIDQIRGARGPLALSNKNFVRLIQRCDKT